MKTKRNGRQTLDCGCWCDNLIQHRCPLHAATPELLEALQRLNMCPALNCGNLDAETIRACDDACAAIAKAVSL